MKGTFKSVRRITMAGVLFIAGSVCSGSLLAIPTATDITPDNAIKTFGLMTRVLDGNNYIVKLYDDRLYQKLKGQARDNEDRLQYLNDEDQTIHFTIPNIHTPSATSADNAVKTLRGMQIGASVRNFTEGKEALVDCQRWLDDGRLECGVLTRTEDDKWLDVGAWLIYRGYSPYVTDNGNNPRHHESYLRYSRRHQ